MRRQFAIQGGPAEPEEPNPFQLMYVTLPVRDLDASAAWWCRLLGWDRLLEYEESYSDGVPVVIGPAQGGSARIGFLPVTGQAALPPAKVSLAVAEADAPQVLREWREHGLDVEVDDDFAHSDWLRTFQLTDPDGHVIEIIW